MNRKSEARGLRCPRCKKRRLIKSGFTKSKYGKWQRFKCLSCKLITTKPKLDHSTHSVTGVHTGSELIEVRRDSKGRFIKVNVQPDEDIIVQRRDKVGKFVRRGE